MVGFLSYDVSGAHIVNVTQDPAVRNLFEIFRKAWFSQAEGQGNEGEESGSNNDDPEVDPMLMMSEDLLHPA